jgi:hypothetical protein
MTTTGTTAFNPDLNDIVEEAFERAGSQLRSGYDMRTARRSLNLLTIEWANRGINLWTIESGSIPMVAGTATYSLPTDTIDLIEHVIRTNDGSTSLQSDITISRISVDTYASIPAKLNQGRPIQVWVNRQSAQTYPSGGNSTTGLTQPAGVTPPTITVWPVPNVSSTYTFVYWRLRRIQDAGNGINTQDIPFRFVTCMAAGLAYYLAQKIPECRPNIPFLQAEYERQWMLASEEDREKAAFRFVPRVGYMR